MKARILREKNDVKPIFKVGDVIRRRPLASYNYQQPVQKIKAIKENLYLFEEKGLALEIWAQNEWEPYNTWWRKMLIGIREFVKWVFRYHQPTAMPLKHVGRQKKRPGHTMFEINSTTGDIRVAPVLDNSVTVKEGCIYRQALNKKSLIKKLRRQGINVKE